eukprot:g7498.t1
MVPRSSRFRRFRGFIWFPQPPPTLRRSALGLEGLEASSCCGLCMRGFGTGLLGWSAAHRDLAAQHSAAADENADALASQVGSAIFYKDANYGGGSLPLTSSSSWLGSTWNDQISSLRVPTGGSVTLYEHSDYQGNSQVFTQDSSWVGSYWNDKASSIRVNLGSGGGGTCGNGSRGNGDCANGQCCSQFGWCGTAAEHCGTSPPTSTPIGNWMTCSAGATCADNWSCCVAPADVSSGKMTCRPGWDCASTQPQPPTGNVGVTQDVFNRAVEACGFPRPTSAQYTAFNAGIPKSNINSRRELAMLLAQLMQESDGLRATSEYRCNPASNCLGDYGGMINGHQYFGRGYIQLTWYDNYRDASIDLYGDANILLNNPEAVAVDQNKAWGVTFSYWKRVVHNAPGVQQGQFGASTNAINGAIECRVWNQNAQRRFEFYKKILPIFGVNETPNSAGCQGN